jgi:hypothetical protein
MWLSSESAFFRVSVEMVFFMRKRWEMREKFLKSLGKSKHLSYVSFHFIQIMIFIFMNSFFLLSRVPEGTSESKKKTSQLRRGKKVLLVQGSSWSSLYPLTLLSRINFEPVAFINDFRSPQRTQRMFSHTHFFSSFCTGLCFSLLKSRSCTRAIMTFSLLAFRGKNSTLCVCPR